MQIETSTRATMSALWTKLREVRAACRDAVCSPDTELADRVAKLEALVADLGEWVDHPELGGRTAGEFWQIVGVRDWFSPTKVVTVSVVDREPEPDLPRLLKQQPPMSVPVFTAEGSPE